MNFRRHRRSAVEISLTPMIDVVFLLLIFFMVTTTFQKESALKINLPEAKGQKQAERETLDIVIDPQGRYYINRHQLVNTRIETLKRALARAKGQGPRPLVVISADKKTPHQAVIRALDAARQVGLIHISFATQTASESQE
ncbi:MAG: biopolymer transporter [Methylothermaceae bacteria B42]|nr:MAG: biopolymer transporter [Methylothermaceae bacteria B42]HHJ40085.1 biopolymer transporter ExbD [Methylothermaceae bacterium]